MRIGCSYCIHYRTKNTLQSLHLIPSLMQFNTLTVISGRQVHKHRSRFTGLNKQHHLLKLFLGVHFLDDIIQLFRSQL